MDPVAAFREQARACHELGSPMYGDLLDFLADDLERGGPTHRVIAGHEDDSGPSALAARLMGSVHRLVLAGRAPELAAFYPTAGGAFESPGARGALLRLLSHHPDAAREWLDRAPQTNEVGRSAPLYGGLLHLPWELPVRLFEIGSSGGLNLRADHFAYVTATGVLGDSESGVLLDPAWGDGPGPRRLRIVERVGSDIAPVDLASEEGRLRVTAYVWPDQTARHRRLAAAIAVAVRVPAEIRRQGAVGFVRSLDLREGATTVLWHSVMFQYLSAADQRAVRDRVQELGAQATATSPFAHLVFEPARRSPGADHEFLVRLETWPGGESRFLGNAPPHGLPVAWG